MYYSDAIGFILSNQYEELYCGNCNIDPTVHNKYKTQLKNVLSNLEHLGIETSIELGLLSKFTQFMYCLDDQIRLMSINHLDKISQAEFEPSIVLTELVKGYFVQSLIDNLHSPNPLIVMSTIHVVDNILCTAAIREIFDRFGYVVKLVQLIENRLYSHSVLLNEYVSLFAQYFCDQTLHGTLVPYDTIRGSMDKMIDIICKYKFKASLESKIIHSLSFFTDHMLNDNGKWIGYLVGVVTDGKDYLQEKGQENGSKNERQQRKLQEKALRCIGNFLSGTESQTQAAIDHGIIAILYRLMDSKISTVRAEALWGCSNLLCGSEEQIRLISNYDHCGIIFKIVGKLNTEGGPALKEALYCICNLISGIHKQKDYEYMDKLVREMDIIDKLAPHYSFQLSNLIVESFNSIIECGRIMSVEQDDPKDNSKKRVHRYLQDFKQSNFLHYFKDYPKLYEMLNPINSPDDWDKMNIDQSK